MNFDIEKVPFSTRGSYLAVSRFKAGFCNLAAASGFAENFNALTGEGLRDKAYTWTSSVFLTLAEEYLT